MNEVNNTGIAIPKIPIIRNVKAWSPKTGVKEFTSHATTSNELKDELKENGFIVENMKISEIRTGLDITNNNAILPVNILNNGILTNDLGILISPLKNQGGMMSYKEAKVQLKGFFEKNADFKKYVKETMGNWTQFTTEQLNQVVNTFNERYSDEKPVKKTPAKKTPYKVIEKQEKLFEEIQNIAEKYDVNCFKTSEYKTAIEYINQGMQMLLGGITLLNSVISDNTVNTLTEDDFISYLKKWQ